MKKTLLLLSLVFTSGAFAATEKCTEPADATFAKVEAKPAAVLEIVAADVAATPKCACPIVKAAIAASKADSDLQGDIVAAALNSAPDEAAAIKACLPKAVYGKGGGKGTTGKETVIPPTEAVEDGWFDSLIYGAGGMGSYGGAYGSSPASGGGSAVDLNPDGEEIIVVIENPSPPRVIVIRPPTRA